MKSKLIPALVVVGLSLCGARAQSQEPYDVLNFSLTGLMPALNSHVGTMQPTRTGEVRTYKDIAVKVKITNKEILKLLEQEAGVLLPKGKLVGLEGSVFVVDNVDRNKANELYEPGEFYYEHDSDTVVEAGTETDTLSYTATKSSKSYSGSGTETGLGQVVYNAGPGKYFNIWGLVTSSYSNSGSWITTEASETESGKYKTSFSATGAGTGFIGSAGGEGIFSGKITGTRSSSWKYTY